MPTPFSPAVTSFRFLPSSFPRSLLPAIVLGGIVLLTIGARADEAGASAHRLAVGVPALETRPVLEKFGAIDPARGKLGVTNYYFEQAGRPLPILSGEIHPQRVPVEEW